MDTLQFIEILREKKIKMICAESITAGLLASTIASVSGASDVLIGSIVTYDEKFKIAILNVDPQTLADSTAESIETTTEMCLGITNLYPSADLFVAVTGMASKPGLNYKSDKEVGQIYVVINYNEKTHFFENKFEDLGRNAIREETVSFIMNKIIEVVNH